MAGAMVALVPKSFIKGTSSSISLSATPTWGAADGPGATQGAYAWVVRASQGQESLTLWDQQPTVAGPTGQNAPATAQWLQMPGSFGTSGTNTAVTAGPGGRVWAADGSGLLYQSVP